MVTVIIPILNEEETIAKIVRSVKKFKIVDEIIIIDDKSLDNSVERAKELSVRVITSTKLGKGASMRDGLLVAKNDIIVYLDGDIENYCNNFINKITKPLISNTYDFVKTTFEREAGRVTELVAKPLLSLLFPELAKFSQPLSGIIAGRKKYFEQIVFEDDYGVDIGILIDMYKLGVKMTEVNIGKIEHKMKKWKELGIMSKAVSRAILKRATSLDINELEAINIIRDQMEFAIKDSLLNMKKMIIFDMDNTILLGRFIYDFAECFGLKKELLKIVYKNGEPFVKTKLVAKLLKDKDIGQIIEFIDKMPIVPDAIQTIETLKKKGYIVGIISDSYDVIANHIKNKIGADFSLANELEFSESKATGEVKIPSFFIRNPNSKCKCNYCKSNALLTVAEKYLIPTSNIVAVGDGDGDRCMLKFAGLGVAFCSDSNELKNIADFEINEKRFEPILNAIS